MRHPRPQRQEDAPGFKIERSSEYLGVSMKQPAPQYVAHDEHRRGTRLAVLLGDPSSEKRFNAKKIKSIRRNPPAGKLFSSLAAAEMDVCIGKTDHVFERVVLFVEIEKDRDRELGNGDVVWK
jgi:hypothetical protein